MKNKDLKEIRELYLKVQNGLKFKDFLKEIEKLRSSKFSDGYDACMEDYEIEDD
jgi:hypothetical protein